MRQYGLIHYHVNAMNPNMKHEGLDIARSERARSKTEMQLELNDFELLNGTYIMSHSTFDRNAIAKLFDTVIAKYYEQASSALKTEEAVPESQEPQVQMINGKVIKSITNTNGKFTVETHDDKPSELMSKFVNDIINLNSAVQLQLQERILLCANSLRVGTLDMPKDSKEIVVHTATGYEPLKSSVSRQQMIATLWFVTKSYMFAPSFRKHLTVSITEGKYTAGYDKGILYFKTDDLSDLEKAIIADLKLIG